MELFNRKERPERKEKRAVGQTGPITHAGEAFPFPKLSSLRSLRCNSRSCSQAVKVSVAELPREAFGVRGACSRFRTALRRTTAPASWTHSKRFAQFGCGFAALRSLWLATAGPGYGFFSGTGGGALVPLASRSC